MESRHLHFLLAKLAARKTSPACPQASCPLCPTGCDPRRPRAVRATTPVGCAVEQEHGSETQPPPRFWSTNRIHSHPRGQLGSSTALPGKAGRSPVTSTGSTPTSGNCSLSTEIQQKLLFFFFSAHMATGDCLFSQHRTCH